MLLTAAPPLSDLTKTSRERHVTHKLYAFFVFNNLIIFTAFSVFWEFIATIIKESQKNGERPDVWRAIRDFRFATKLVTSVFGISSFWVMYLLQRNMGAVLDVAQVVSLVWTSFARRFLSPTPRQIIERTAPPTFDYASYYNYFLFYTTVALSFATLQPIILIVAFLYFQIDSWLKKYLLMYVFVSKVESGGAFWRLLFNRFLFAAAFSNLIVGIVVWVQYDSSLAWAWIVPLPVLLLGFKWYCRRKFDDEMHFRTKVSDRESLIAAASGKLESSHKDKLRTKFGNPALYRPLIVPMVHKKAQDVLVKVYQGRLNSEQIRPSIYGDVDLEIMQSGGKVGRPMRPLDGQFKLVAENELDLEAWRGREEFVSGHARSEGYSGYGYDGGAGSGYGSGMNTPTPGFHGFNSGSPSSSRVPSPASFNRSGPDYHLVIPGVTPSSSRPGSPHLRPGGGLGLSSHHAGYDPVPLDLHSNPGTPQLAPLGSVGFAPSHRPQAYTHPYPAHHQAPLHPLDIQRIRSGYSEASSSQDHPPSSSQAGYKFSPSPSREGVDSLKENLLPPPQLQQQQHGSYEEFRKRGV